MSDEGNNGDDEKQVCGLCKHWRLIGANPQLKMSFGACANEEHEEAPFGVVTAGFGSCTGFEKREAPKQIVVPKSRVPVNRIQGL